MSIEVILQERDFIGIGTTKRVLDVFDGRIEVVQDFITHFPHLTVHLCP